MRWATAAATPRGIFDDFEITFDVYGSPSNNDISQLLTIIRNEAPTADYGAGFTFTSMTKPQAETIQLAGLVAAAAGAAAAADALAA